MDGLRFTVILAVVLFHIIVQLQTKRHVSSNDLLWHVISIGKIGVQVFFCLSGFFLSLPFAEWHISEAKGVQLRTYYLRRIVRIEPPYFLNMFLLFAALPVFSAHPNTRFANLPHFAASALYLHGIVFNSMSTINPVAWSLEVETQFYLLAPFICQVFRLRSVWLRRGALLTAIAGCSLAAPGILASGAPWRSSILPFTSSFLAGLFVQIQNFIPSIELPWRNTWQPTPSATNDGTNRSRWVAPLLEGRAPK